MLAHCAMLARLRYASKATIEHCKGDCWPDWEIRGKEFVLVRGINALENHYLRGHIKRKS